MIAPWLVVAFSVALVVLVGVVLVRQGSPADLSEQAGSKPGRHVMDRPAGPDAESMTAERPAAEGGRQEVDETIRTQHERGGHARPE